jgi:hypothetical protein
MIEGVPGRHRVTVAADKAYDTHDFVANLREMTVTRTSRSRPWGEGARSMRGQRGLPAMR